MVELVSVPEIPDAVWKYLSQEQKDAHNRKIEAKNEFNDAAKAYNTSMNLTDPTIVMIIGGIVGFILNMYLVIAVFILVVIWVFIRVMSRSQAYQRYRDADAAFKAALQDGP